MPQTRRKLLHTAGLLSLGLAAGCLGDAGGGGSGDEPTETTTSPDDTSTETPTDTTTEAPDDTTDMPDDTTTDDSSGTDSPDASTISLASVDSAPDIPLEPAVEVTKAEATQDHPPQVEVTLSNTSGSVVEAGEGRDIFFQHVSDETNELTFLPAGKEYPADPGCWRLTESLFVTQEYRMEQFDPDESRSKTVDLYGMPKKDGGCLPVGEYRFETTISIGEMDGSEGDKTDVQWGFSVTLE
ncbi:hypothetical protein ACH9L7_16960 (plasmid) [Haloferax sp. S1W]|uniref:hypothetical protein n=1 Tax=Haloferax sp. S1W TaxID=3377110 RepID=UPI0037C66455